jgi:hypothetical protein
MTLGVSHQCLTNLPPPGDFRKIRSLGAKKEPIFYGKPLICRILRTDGTRYRLITNVILSINKKLNQNLATSVITKNASKSLQKPQKASKSLE